MRCELISFKGGEFNPESASLQLPAEESRNSVIAVVDIFGYFIAFDTKELKHTDFLNSKKLQKENEKVTSQVVIFKHAQDIGLRLIDSPPTLVLFWTSSDTKGQKVNIVKGLVCESPNPEAYLKEFYENLKIVVGKV